MNMTISSIKDLFTYAEDATIEDAADEAVLIEAAKAGDEEAQTRLIIAYGPALRSAVKRFMKRLPVEERGGKEDDAQMEALAAFMEVLHQHDPEKNPRLAGRLASRLVAALANAAQMDAVMTIPERTLSRFYGILRAAEGDLETASEMAPSMGMSIHVFNDIRAVVHDATTLTVDDDEDGDRFLAQPLHSNLYTAYDEVEDHVIIDMAFKAVDDEEARIVELAYGFTEYEPVPDAEVGHRLGLTRPTVQRKRGKAIEKMREALGVTAEGQW